MGYYAAWNGISLPTFRDKVPGPSSTDGLLRSVEWYLSTYVSRQSTGPIFNGWKRVPIGCPETSVRNYHYSLHNSPEERRSHPLRGGSLKPPTVIASSEVIFNRVDIVGCSCYIFQFNRSFNSKWQFLGCAIVAFSERHVCI